MAKFIITTTLVLSCLLVNANDALTYLEKMRSNYMDLKSFSVELNYTLYKGYKSNAIAENYQSHFYSDGENAYRDMNGIEILVQDDKMITLDKSSQTMILSSAQKLSFQEVDFDEVLENCGNLSIETIGSNHLIHVDFKTNQNNPYSKLSIAVDHKFMIKKVTLFFAKKINFSKRFGEHEMDFPRLEIEYMAFSKKWKDTEGIIDLRKYIEATDQGFKVAENYKNYELIDLRLTNQN